MTPPALADNENAPDLHQWLRSINGIPADWPGRSHGGNGSAQSIRGSTIGPASMCDRSFHEVPYAE